MNCRNNERREGEREEGEEMEGEEREPGEGRQEEGRDEGEGMDEDRQGRLGRNKKDRKQTTEDSGKERVRWNQKS